VSDPFFCLSLAIVLAAVLPGCTWQVRTAAGSGAAVAPEPRRTFHSPRPQETDVRQALLHTRISVDLKDVPLYEVLEMLAMRAGVSLSVDGRVSSDMLRRPVTLKLERVMVYSVFHWIFRRDNLVWVVTGNEIRVTAPELAPRDALIEQGGFAERTEAQWYNAKLAELSKRKMSVEVAEVPFERVMSTAAEHVGFNVVWAPGTEKFKRKPVTVSIIDHSITALVDDLTTAAGTGWLLEMEAVVITPIPK
jgi:hypothetical protein